MHTPEQLAILDRAISRTAPVLAVNAGPGCGKTFTIVEIIKLLAPTAKQNWKMNQCRLVYTAFNKDIVNSTAAKLVDAGVNRDGIYKVDCATFNSLGLRRFKGSLDNPRQSITLNTHKNKDCLKEVQDLGRFSISGEEWGDLETLMRLAKSQGYLPKGSGSAFGSLIDYKSLCKLGDITPEPHYEPTLDAALKISIRKAFNYELDFDDQLYMAAMFAGASSDRPEFLFVDEAQDLTPIQLFLVKRIKPEFLILVGDPMQAIYAFRGAMSDSFQRIFAVWPDAIQLPLLTSFRIPQATIELLRERNPGLRTKSPIIGSLESPAKSMSIQELLGLSAYDLANKLFHSRAILCRNNAPLYRVALACISARIPFNLSDENWGNAIVRDIKRVMRGNLDQTPDPAFLTAMITFWQQRAGDDAKMMAVVWDKIASLETLIDVTQPSSVTALCLTIASLLKKSTKEAKLLLSTAHKAKGLEFDFVVHLDSHLIPAPFAKNPDQIAQEHNIAYVINSRTRDQLVFIDSDNITIPGAPVRKPRNPAKKEPIA